MSRHIEIFLLLTLSIFINYWVYQIFPIAGSLLSLINIFAILLWIGGPVNPLDD